LKNCYDLTKILKLSPIEFGNMSVIKRDFFVKEISHDIEKKDPYILPAPQMRLF